MIAIHFLGWKELHFRDIKDSGLSEDIFDTIVRNDNSNTNLKKMALLAQGFTKFLRMNKPFFKDFKNR